MNENAITYKIIKYMNSVPNCFARKRHGGAFSQGDPDIMGAIKGLAFAVEMKMETGELTKLQAVMLDKWMGAGAETSVAIYDPATKQLRIVTRIGDSNWLSIAGKVRDWSESMRIKLDLPSVQTWVEHIRCNGSRG